MMIVRVSYVGVGGAEGPKQVLDAISTWEELALKKF